MANARNIELAREAARKYEGMTLKATYFKPVRRKGGGYFHLYQLTGEPEALAAYQEVMSQIPNPNPNSDNKTLFIQDPVTDKILFPQPNGANGKSFEVTWTTGNPDANPNGRFVANDGLRLVEQDIVMEEKILAAQAQILAMARLGQTQVGRVGELNEPRSKGNQSLRANSDDLTEEKIAEELARQKDANA